MEKPKLILPQNSLIASENIVSSVLFSKVKSGSRKVKKALKKGKGKVQEINVLSGGFEAFPKPWKYSHYYDDIISHLSYFSVEKRKV